MALKVIARTHAGDTAARERFRREGELLTRLRHPNIVRTIRTGEQDGHPYIVAEFVDGPSLAEFMDRGPVTPAAIVAIVADVAAALGAAHAAGVVHRDVTPANIMLNRRGRAVLGDFGIAKDLSDAAGATLTGGFIGTPAYASPEQLAGAPVSPASDQYSLACVVYELLTGRRPFSGTAAAVVDAHLRAAPPDANVAGTGVPRALAEVVATALQKAPADRYASVEAFAATFRRQAPVRAMPPSLGMRRARPGRRSALATVLAAAGVAGLVALTWWSRPDTAGGVGDPLSFMVRSGDWTPFGAGLVVKQSPPDGLRLSVPPHDYLPLRGVVHRRTGSCDFTYSTGLRIVPPPGTSDGVGVGIGVGTRLVRGVPRGWTVQFEVHEDRALWLREVVLPVQAVQDQPPAQRIADDGLAEHAVALAVHGSRVDVVVDGALAAHSTLPPGTGCGAILVRVWGGGAALSGMAVRV